MGDMSLLPETMGDSILVVLDFAPPPGITGLEVVIAAYRGGKSEVNSFPPQIAFPAQYFQGV